MILCEGSRAKFNSHDPIIYEEKYCPLCEALNEIEELKEELARLQEQLVADTK